MSKLPMIIAAQDLERVCEAIDERGANEALEKLLAEGAVSLSNSVDRRIYFLELAKDRIKTFKRIRKELLEASKRLEHAIAACKERTISIMEEFPNLPYRGELGRFKAQNDSVGEVSLPEIRTTEASVRNIVDAQDIKKHQIDEKFYEAKTYYTLMIGAIRTALENGEDVPWASITKGRHLRWTKT